LAQAQDGDVVTILYSNLPLVVSGRAAIPSGVTLTGRAEAGTGELPVVDGAFDVGSDVTVRGFYSQGPPPNFDLSGSANVTLREMHIVNGSSKVDYDDVTGEIRFLSSVFEGNGPGGTSLRGQISSGQASFTVSDCDLIGSSVRIDCSDAATTVNLLYQDNRSSGGINVNPTEGATTNVQILDNTFTGELGGQGFFMEFGNESRGDVTYNNNRMTATGGVFVRRSGTGGEGRFTLLNNVWRDAAALPYRFIFDDGGNFDLVFVNNQAIANQAGNQLSDFSLTAGGSARIRARIQNNSLSYGVAVQATDAAVLDVGILDNAVGNNPLAAGPGRRNLILSNSGTFTGIITAIVTGNVVGTLATPSGIFITETSGVVQLERLASLGSDNTLFGGNTPSVSPGVTQAPDGSTDLPPLP
jgi:hypothetical protein